MARKVRDYLLAFDNDGNDKGRRHQARNCFRRLSHETLCATQLGFARMSPGCRDLSARARKICTLGASK